MDPSTADYATLLEAYEALTDAYETATEVNPITAGYYYIVSAGNGSGYSGGPYNDENEFAMYNADGYVNWDGYNKAYKQIYQFTSDDNGNWYVQNVADGTYISCGESYTGSGVVQGCNVLTSASADYAQVFALSSTGKWKMTFSPNTNMYGLRSNHNGAGTLTSGKIGIWGTSSDADNYGMNVWYLYSVEEATVTESAQKAELIEELSALCTTYEETYNSTEANAGLTDFKAAYDAAQTLIAQNYDETSVSDYEDAISTLSSTYRAISLVVPDLSTYIIKSVGESTSASLEAGVDATFTDGQWYVVTQTRTSGSGNDQGAETPVYDTGAGNSMYRRSASNTVSTILTEGTFVTAVDEYLVRFVEGAYDNTWNVQFANGNVWTNAATSATATDATSYFIYTASNTNLDNLVGYHFNVTTDGTTYGS